MKRILLAFWRRASRSTRGTMASRTAGPGRPLPVVLGVLAACSGAYSCSGSPDVPIASDVPDLAAPIDGSSLPPTPTCRPGVTATLPLPLTELHAATPFVIEVGVSDSGGLTEPHPVKVVIRTADATLVKTLVDAPQPLGKLSLSFTPGAEKDLPTGALQVTAEVGCPGEAAGPPGRATAALYLVRLGATKLVVGDGEGGGRVPLMYHALDQRANNYFPIPATLATSSLAIPLGEPELDKPDGSPRSFPDQPWAELTTPPVDGSGVVIETGYTIPVSLTLGTRPDLVFTMGKTASSPTGAQPTGLGAAGLPPIRLVVDGTPGSDAGRVSEGGEATVRLATSPVPAIARVDQRLTWHFEFQGQDGTYARIPDSQQAVTLRFYGVLGNTQGMMAPDLPWVAVVDEVTQKIAGSATDAPTARAILVQHIYEELGLAYDRKGGASHYTTYSGGWNSARFSLSDFLKRSRGNIVNCSDCASILSTYANMIGAKLSYSIIGSDFKLNPILGIGATTFGSPFDSGRLGFSYHAVTTPDATLTINDATLALDGDGDPKLAPHTTLLVQNLSGVDYLTRLSPTYGTGTPVYQYKDQITHAR